MKIPTSAELTVLAWCLTQEKEWKVVTPAQMRWLNHVEGSPDEPRKSKPKGMHQNVWKKGHPPMGLSSSAAQ